MTPLERNFETLRNFIAPGQLEAMRELCRSEEGDHFKQLVASWHGTISGMPGPYATDGHGESATVRLHYFIGGSDWYIIERDDSDAQLQCFGLADLFGDGGELGYISIVELLKNRVEFDLYWEPITLRELRAQRKRRADDTLNIIGDG